MFLNLGQPLLEVSRVDILYTLLHCIGFNRVLSGGRWVIVGCCNGSSYEKRLKSTGIDRHYQQRKQKIFMGGFRCVSLVTAPIFHVMPERRIEWKVSNKSIDSKTGRRCLRVTNSYSNACLMFHLIYWICSGEDAWFLEVLNKVSPFIWVPLAVLCIRIILVYVTQETIGCWYTSRLPNWHF